MAVTVSVIIPTYNVEAYIEECIESILNQTYRNYEIVICDDCSTDRTADVLEKFKKYPNIIIYENKRNLRQARTRNKCIRMSKGKFIMIQDADDIAEPQRIEKLLGAFESGIDFVGSGCYCFNEKDGHFKDLGGLCKYPQKRDLLRGIPFVHASIMFKRECLKSVNGYQYNKYTFRGEDYDLILRLYASGFKGKNIPDLLYGYRVNRETINRRDLRSRIDECHIRYAGFKANGILFPIGWLWTLKPIPAYFLQMIQYRRIS